MPSAPSGLGKPDAGRQAKSASFADGLLKIDLVREVPEAMKPRCIAINTTNNPTIEQTKAA